MSHELIEKLPPLREVIAAHGLRAEKKLGQNFLLDLNVTDKIARAAGDLGNATVFEIGPGPGGLTRSLLKAGAKQVIAVEFDPRAVEALEGLRQAAGGRLSIVQGDALHTNLLAMAPDGERIIVANLPYNIATPLLVGWLGQIHQDPQAYSRMVLMFQHEVAVRITAAAGGKAYGRLAVLAQWLCKAQIMYSLPPQAFTPPPKVTSSVVRLEPLATVADKGDFAVMEKITAAAFGQRRKMLRSSLRDYAEGMVATGIDPALRAEDVGPLQYAALAAYYSR